MRGKSAKKVRYLDSKGMLYSNGIMYEQGMKNPHWNKEDHKLVKNYSALQNILRKEEEEHEALKKQLNLLQKQRELLQWHLCNNVKKLSMQRSESKFKEQFSSKLEVKLKLLKESAKMYTLERDILEDEVKKMEEQLQSKVNLKANVEKKFNLWMDKKNEYLKDVSQERRSAFQERNNRQKELSKLLLVVKQEGNKSYDMDYLKMCEFNLINQLSHHKDYKMLEMGMAKGLGSP
ncbi:conserved Plasmodium protein, unknown function [Plasmodium knowlesi strain H]|uniref:Uncharacterized protein n=3 Tax=Plasmodium knowlesi TaxID=5850 RepID=A0A5K1VEL5_PLAKH|nr:conserved Plasmodium protein, unknown function [Plasmodium knowlesi strain H]OTN66814.1 Uncharacterized protein PKNOH_S08503500 [Plasmodium knowlesi]CAA9986696.1 conserved Plasmodium protein, unknown function [Plasmodium knowlesi strain H]SBO23508.1 conserved Plasmodium protein, unknown function [Plasmodium knowlesi strain H]SBO24999.1 conserved Plasmodium protein, unknown function [Plasmodium knowlesi strain H]VVS76170.1 conserved Plasmodium protein, unknown function [Plasmodium knowlesi s|eukprot:XP_002257881.1 hypothetical protein, conserved in Plasmodium species [Plasmodium knowlesi strain H]